MVSLQRWSIKKVPCPAGWTDRHVVNWWLSRKVTHISISQVAQWSLCRGGSLKRCHVLQVELISMLSFDGLSQGVVLKKGDSNLYQSWFFKKAICPAGWTVSACRVDKVEELKQCNNARRSRIPQAGYRSVFFILLESELTYLSVHPATTHRGNFYDSVGKEDLRVTEGQTVNHPVGNACWAQAFFLPS